MITSLRNLTAGILFLIFLRCTVHGQSNSRSYDTNDWIPLSQPYQSGNFPQLHAVHGKQSKPSDANAQFQDLPQVPNVQQQQTNQPIKEQRLNSAQQIRLSPPTVEAPKQVAQANQATSQEGTLAQHIAPPPLQPSPEKEEVQLLYVPLETLRQREQRKQIFQDHAASQSQVRYVDQQNLTPQAHKQVQLHNIEQDFIQQALQAHKLQQQLQQLPQQNYQLQHDQQFQPQQGFLEATTKVPTTSSPKKKRKPHQPPLAIYMSTDDFNEISVSDLLGILKDAKTITVQDYVGEDSPKVFVGPSNLPNPEGYVKFNLPYLSSLDKQKRQGIDNLPFFVAPLNYKTPQGYSKIPFPSPHVGSVVINQRKQELREKPKVPQQNLLINQPLNEKNNQLVYTEASTVPTHNKNRQVFSTAFSPTPRPPATSIEAEIPYGPLPIKQQLYEEVYSTPRNLGASPSPETTTTPKTFTEPQPSIAPLYLNHQFSRGHRFSTPTPPTADSFTTPSAPIYTVTTSRNPSRTSHIHQRPQVEVPNEDYYDPPRSKASNRYLPEVNQPQKPSTTTEKYLEEPEEVVSQQELTNQQYNEDYNQKSQETIIPPVKIGFEAQITRGNFSVSNLPVDQEYRPSYQSANVPNQYEINTERPRQKVQEKPKVVTEATYVSSVPNQYILNNQHFQVPLKTPSHEDVEEKDEEPAREEHHIQLAPSPPPVLYQQLPHQNHRFVFDQQYEQKEDQDEPKRNQYEIKPAQYIPERDKFETNQNQFEPKQNEPTHNQPSQYEPKVNEYEPKPHQYETPTFVTTEKQKIEYTTTPNPPKEYYQQHYKLPANLPISPYLPSLVNSLEDQAIRPLLAPLLLPSGQEADLSFNDYNEPPKEAITTPPSSTPPTTIFQPIVISSTTPESIIETTTPYKRVRNRNRGTRPTNSPTRSRTSANRGRRPYQEINKQEYVDNVRSTTERTLSRNHYQRERLNPPPEPSRDVVSISPQKRFRTRGRPLKLQEEPISYPEKAGSTESLVEIPPSTQQATHSLINVQVTPGSLVSSTEDERKTYINSLQNEQPLSYLINGEHIINQGIPSNEEVEPQIYVIKDAPVEEVKTEAPPIAKELIPPVRETTKAPIDQSQYLVETTKPRTRTRARGRTRTRTQPHTTTTVSTTTIPSTTTPPTKQEEVQEFFGFFRPPSFKPPKMEYKQSSELRATGLPIPQSTFAPQYTEENTFYVSDVVSSTPRVYQIHSQDEIQPQYNENKNQYLIGRVPSTPDTSYEDVKPVTVRTTPPRRRYTAPTQQNNLEPSTAAPEKYFTVRPKTRPDSQTQRITRIRGSRIRKPTTPLPKLEVSSEENYSARPQTALQRDPSIYQRTRGRGKTHFKLKQPEKSEEDDDISENYPPNFLKAQTAATVAQTVATIEQTQRPSFKLTIEPEDTLEEQEGAYSTRVTTRSKEVVKGEESQRYEKTVEGPNQIKTEKTIKDDKKGEEKLEANTTPISAKLVDKSTENTSANDASEDTTEVENATESQTTSKEDETTVPATTEAVSTESGEKVTRKKGRRGAWKLVAHRPVDMFQSAESQNIGTVYANDLFERKAHTKDYSTAQVLSDYVVRDENKQKTDQMENGTEVPNEKGEDAYDIISLTTEKPTTIPQEDRNETQMTTDKAEETKTTLSEPDTTIFDEQTTLTTEVDDQKDQPEIDGAKTFFDEFMSNLDKYAPVTEKGSLSDFWKNKIIGTSTTTEISHETEICYKGRCIKSLM